MTESKMSIESEESPNIISLGLAMKELRESAGLSISDAARSLNINISIIEDIEMRLDEVIDTHVYSTVYLRGYLLSYGKLVGLDNIENFTEFNNIVLSKKDEITFKQTIHISINNKSKWKVILLVILMLIVIGISVYFFGVSISKNRLKVPSIEQVQANNNHNNNHNNNNNNNNNNKNGVSNVPAGQDASAVLESKPNADKLKENKPNADNLKENKPNADNLKENKPNADNLKESKPNADNLKESKPNADNLKENKPNADNLKESKPNADNLKESKPNADNLKESKPTADNLKENKPNADNLKEDEPNADKSNKPEVTERVKKIAIAENVQSHPKNIKKQKLSDESILRSSPKKKLASTNVETLKITYLKNCWTEIVDAKNKRLAYGLYAKAKIININGTPPFKLFLGDPSGVSILREGKKVDMDFTVGKAVNFSLK